MQISKRKTSKFSASTEAALSRHLREVQKRFPWAEATRQMVEGMLTTIALEGNELHELDDTATREALVLYALAQVRTGRLGWEEGYGVALGAFIAEHPESAGPFRTLREEWLYECRTRPHINAIRLAAGMQTVEDVKGEWVPLGDAEDTRVWVESGVRLI